jgi:DNA-binding beta-propeller fold protein YncE
MSKALELVAGRRLIAPTIFVLSFALNAQAAELYVAYFYESSVQKFSSTGEHLATVVADTGGYYPQSMALDSQGNVYVANIYSYANVDRPPTSIRKFSSTGADLGVIVEGHHMSAYTMAVDRHDNLYYESSGTIRRFGPDGADLGIFFTGIVGSSRA